MELLELADLVQGVLTGNAEAQYKMARMHLTGVGADATDSEAFRLSKLSAEQGYERAYLLLARCYRFGWGTQKSIDDALKWYEKATQNGDQTAKEEYFEVKSLKRN